MKKLNHTQKRFFYLGVTLFISLTLVAIISAYFTQAQVIITLFWKIVGALSAVWIGLIIAYLVNPIVEFFEKNLFGRFLKKKKGLAKGLSVALSLILLIAVLITLLILVIPQLIESINALIHNAPEYYKAIRGWVADYAEDHPSFGPQMLDFLDNGYKGLIDWLKNDLLASATQISNVTNGLMSAVGILINFFVGIIISIYLLCDKDNFLAQTRKVSAAVFSEKWNKRILNLCSETHHIFGEFIIGKIIDSLLVGVVTAAFMWLADIPYAVLVSTLLAVCNLIPFFGQFIGMIPSFLLILVESPVKAIIWLVVIVIYMQIDGNVISPKILGESIGLKSFWILFSIIFFGGMFGVVGMLVGVPVFAIIYRIVRRILDRRLERRGLPTVAYAYQAGDSIRDIEKKQRKEEKEERKEKREEKENKNE